MADGLDLANFLARNRQAGGVNAQLANALQANLSPGPGAAPVAPPVRPGLFGVRREAGERPERPRPGGGSLLGLAGMLTGGATVPITTIAGLVANDALGNDPSTSLVGALRTAMERGERPDRGRVSRPDRIRSSSNREAGGGFVE